MRHGVTAATLALVSWQGCPTPAGAQMAKRPEPAKLEVGGDLRPIVTFEKRDASDGSSSTDDGLGVRARLRAVWTPVPRLAFGARLAGRCTSGDCDTEFVLDTASSGANGATGGQVTFDELFARWRGGDRREVAVGRLQTSFVLRGGVFPKSLDRNDSNNVNVTWTDGLHAVCRARNGWSSHLVLQRNVAAGTGSIRRGPLDFGDDRARTTHFVGFENTRPRGAVVQRAFDVSYLPRSLLADGDPAGRREDYWAAVGRLAARWPSRTEGWRLRVGAELGYAPETATAMASGLDETGDVEGLAWNVVVSAMEFVPAHSIGVNYGRTGAGWLLSPQFRQNEELFEIRYRWEGSWFPRTEARVRWRDEIDPRIGAVRPRRDFDFYLRVTWQFEIARLGRRD